jgi:hypothetical protein
MKISVGKGPKGDVALDLDILLKTRLLVQANSGGGKSWLLRRLAEQMFGKVPIIIVDPEGEFATLREKFGYVLVGKGGETPADARSASLVAHKLLELRASAVCDIYELKPQVRHHWVRLFLEALVDAPKSLWRPTVVIVDESHVFCPEKGQGESEAYGAMSDLVTRGRKRGFCPVFATQRLAKLSKNVSAEMLNRLVGQTFEEIDLERAADLLSVARSDRQTFFKEMKVTEPGHFWAFGRALAKDRVLMKVGNVLTTHPEPGSAAYSAEPPPAPEKVKALLPKLQDLPKEAEQRARSEADLRAEIRSLKSQLMARPKEPSPIRKPKTVEVPVISVAQIRRIEAMGERMTAMISKLVGGVREAMKGGPARSFSVVKLSTDAPPPMTIQNPRSFVPKMGGNSPDENGGITPAQHRILSALADFEAIGRPEVPRTWVAARAGASHKSSGYSNNLGALRGRGIIEYCPNSVLRLTPDGRATAPAVPSPATTEEMIESCLKIVSPAQGRILKALYEAYPSVLDRETVAATADTSPTSSGYSNNLGALRSAGMIEYFPGGRLKCAAWIFVEERSFQG